MTAVTASMLLSLTACAAGFILDSLFGDPMWLYHPVRLIGNGISIGERLLRKAFGERHLKAAGGVLWVCICALSFLIPFGILHALQRIHPVLRFAAETFWCYQILAARSLYTESMKVYD